MRNSYPEQPKDFGTYTGQYSKDFVTPILTPTSYQPLDPQLTDLAALVYPGNELKVIRVNASATAFEVNDPLPMQVAMSVVF